MFKTCAIAALTTGLLFGAMPAEAGTNRNGTELNGKMPNGIAVNGKMPNGINLNGVFLNGKMPNGTTMQGTGHDSVGSVTIVAVELPTTR